MMQITNGEHKARPEGLAERIYLQLKADIFEFRLLPGDRFSESDVAQRMAASRTPVRQALFRLEREGYVEVLFRSGWQVRPFDFAYFEELYDLRIVLEREAVRRLCALPPLACAETLAALNTVLDRRAAAWSDGKAVSQHDEQFHQALVAAVGNGEMARIHRELTEKIRIIRRLDFTRQDRVDATYREHAPILQAILQQQTEEAQRILTEHIAVSEGRGQENNVAHVAAGAVPSTRPSP